MNTDTITLRELTIRYSVKADIAGQPAMIGRTLSTPAASAAALASPLQDEPAEIFAIICLSTKHRVVAHHEVSRGTLDTTLVHPRGVSKAALLANAAAIVLTHNHPSGDPAPRPDDMALTRRLPTPERCSAWTSSTTSSSAMAATSVPARAVGWADETVEPTWLNRPGLPRPPSSPAARMPMLR